MEPYPQQAGPKIPSWLNVRKKVAIPTLPACGWNPTTLNDLAPVYMKALSNEWKFKSLNSFSEGSITYYVREAYLATPLINLLAKYAFSECAVRGGEGSYIPDWSIKIPGVPSPFLMGLKVKRIPPASMKPTPPPPISPWVLTVYLHRGGWDGCRWQTQLWLFHCLDMQ